MSNIPKMGHLPTPVVGKNFLQSCPTNSCMDGLMDPQRFKISILSMKNEGLCGEPHRSYPCEVETDWSTIFGISYDVFFCAERPAIFLLNMGFTKNVYCAFVKLYEIVGSQ